MIVVFNPYILIGMFNPFMFKVIINMIGLFSTIFFLFLYVSCVCTLKMSYCLHLFLLRSQLLILFELILPLLLSQHLLGYSSYQFNTLEVDRKIWKPKKIILVLEEVFLVALWDIWVSIENLPQQWTKGVEKDTREMFSKYSRMLNILSGVCWLSVRLP